MLPLTPKDLGMFLSFTRGVLPIISKIPSATLHEDAQLILILNQRSTISNYLILNLPALNPNRQVRYLSPFFPATWNRDIPPVAEFSSRRASLLGGSP